MNPFERANDYTPKELMTGAGINTGLYNQWLYRDIFSATNEADGPGTTSSYSFSDILCVALIVRLRSADIRLKKASKLAREIVARLDKWWNKHRGEDWPMVYMVFSDGVKIDIGEDKNKEMVVRLNTDTVVSNICGRIDEMDNK